MKLNEQLEERVEERTRALEAVNEKLRKEIARREQVEEDLRRQKEVLQIIFDHIPVMIGFVDRNRQLQLVNRSWERTLGWSLEEIKSQNIDIGAEVYPDPRDHQRVLELMVKSNAEWADFKTRVKDGRFIDTTWAFVGLSDGATISIGQDISQRKRAEQELRQQKELLQTIFDHIPLMVSFVDREKRVQLVNREWEQTLGSSLDEVQGKNIDLVAADHAPDPEYSEQVLNFLHNSTAEWADFKMKVRDGRVIDTSWAVLHLSDGTGIGIGQDISERKRVEQELRQQKEILETIFDHIPLMINFVDRNHELKLVNREWERTLGWSAEEIQKQNIDILAENYPDPEYRQQVRDFVASSNADWADFKTTVRDGRVIDTSWAMLHLSDGTGIGIGQDISKRKRAEKALRESEERFRQLAENINDLFWIKTPDFKRVLYLSPIYGSMTGRSREERYSDEDDRAFLDSIHPEDREKMAEIMRLGTGEFDVEFRIVRPNGSVRWIRDRGFPIRDQFGQIYRIAGVANDITDRKLAEEALRESEERFRQLAENINEVFWIATADFSQQVYVSPGFQNLTGQPPAALDPGDGYKPFFAFVHPDDLPIVREVTKNPDQKFDVEFRVLHANGSIRWVRDRGFPIRDRQGEIYRIGGVAEDITDRKEAEERLKAGSEQLRALSASLQSAREKEATRIAHQIHDEMGGILTGLRWELEALEKMIRQSADAAPLKMAMQDKLTTMLGLTDATINVVRRIASELRPSILDDLGLMEALEWEAQQFQARTGIECRCDCALQSIPVGDVQSTAVFRIVQEALTNIIRHAQATQVAISMSIEDEMFILTVTDNGRGITQEETLSRKSLGLLGMQERAHLIGGYWGIVGRKGIGSTMRVHVPLSPPDPGAGG